MNGAKKGHPKRDCTPTHFSNEIKANRISAKEVLYITNNKMARSPDTSEAYFKKVQGDFHLYPRLPVLSDILRKVTSEVFTVQHLSQLTPVFCL